MFTLKIILCFAMMGCFEIKTDGQFYKTEGDCQAKARTIIEIVLKLDPIVGRPISSQQIICTLVGAQSARRVYSHGAESNSQ